MHSPLGDLIPTKVGDLPRDFLQAKLGVYFHASPPEKLVEIPGVKMRHFAPRAGPLKQVLLSLSPQKYGPNAAVPQSILQKDALGARPPLRSLWHALRARLHRDENRGSDLVLIEFTPS